MCLRSYRTTDKADCLRLFDTNVPQYFAEWERQGFVDFLEGLTGESDFQVIACGNGLIACGGFEKMPDGTTAGLCWGMVAREMHGTGLGTRLTQARLQRAKAAPGIRRITLDTSQHTCGFYERFGFRVLSIEPDGYGPGLHRCDMELIL